MILKIIAIVLWILQFNVQITDPAFVQVFDVKQEKVIRQIKLTGDLEKSILACLDASPKMYGGFSVNPDSGQILHIKFRKPVDLSSPIYPDLIKEVYIFLENGVPPRALIFFNSVSKNIVVMLNGNHGQCLLQNKLD